MDPSNPTILFAGLEQGGVSRSEDGGQTWQSLSAGLPNVPIRDLLFDPSNANQVYSATLGGGVFLSRDGGQSWGSFSQGLADLQINKLASDSSGSYLFAGGTNLGVWVRQILMNRVPVQRVRNRPGARVVAPRDAAEGSVKRP